ncbi:hypothetical protein CARN8_6610003 [mine drainage metagenome]|uniref:Uncharacterized protein n=1 Tax=mine drainage metagenome TaxID=410659 RepID=A0A3P3ZRZ1_9ZZZZ
MKVIGIARVIFRDEQELAGIRTDFLHCAHGGLNAKGIKFLIQIVETGREQVGVHWCQFIPGIAQVHGGVKRSGVFLPLVSEPMFDAGHCVKNLFFQSQQGAREGGCQMGHHGLVPKV